MKIKLFIVIVFSFFNLQCVSNNRNVEGNLNQIIEKVLIDSSFVSLREECGIDSTNTFYIYNGIIFGYFKFFVSNRTKFKLMFDQKLNDNISSRENQLNLIIEDSLRIANFEEIDIEENKLTRFGKNYDLFLKFDIVGNKYFIIEVYCNNKPHKVISYFFSLEETNMTLIQKKHKTRSLIFE